MLLHPVMVSRVTGLSDIYLTFCILAAVTAAECSWRRGSALGSFLTGILCGLAIGAKPSGLLVLVLVPALALLRGDRAKCLRQLWAVALGTVVGVLPLCLHNYQSYGVIYWPGLALISENPHPHTPVGTVRRVQALKRFSEAILEGATDISGRRRFIPVWFLPFLVYAFASMTYLYIRRRGRCRSTRFFIFAATFLLICAGFSQAAFVRIEWRYWNFVVPLALVTVIASCASLSRVFVWFAMVCSLLAGLDKHWELWKEEIKPVPSEYATVMSMLPVDTIVMTSHPLEFTFHTRIRSVKLPVTDDEILALARRYNAEYLVTQTRSRSNRHEFDDMLTAGETPKWLDHVYDDEDVIIGRIRLP